MLSPLAVRKAIRPIDGRNVDECARRKGVVIPDAFQIREERYVSDALVAKGLRPPQVGAIHAVKAGRHL